MAEKETKFCANCGAEVDVKAMTCPSCGVLIATKYNALSGSNILSKITSSLMYIFGIIFILAAFGGILSGDIIIGFFMLIIGLIFLPATRNYIAKTTKKKRVCGIYAVIIAFILMIMMGMMLPPMDISDETTSSQVATEVFTPTPNPTTIPTAIPTPRDLRTYKDARILLPTQTEIGNGVGWSYSKTTYTASESAAKYYKDNRHVHIHIYIMDSTDNAVATLNDKFIKWGMDGYPSLKTGDDSLYRTAQANDLSDWYSGIFIKDNVIVTIDVYDYFLRDDDIKRYARNVEKKIK